MSTPDLAPALLVVEDDRALSALLVELLTGEGYRVDTAYDGQQGMHRGLTGNYDALVVDRSLPDGDGAAFIADLRARGVSTPAVLMSGTPLTAPDARTRFLQKPFSIDALPMLLATMVSRR